MVSARTTEYSHGTTVKLTAIPSEGWVFTEWRGDAEGENAEIIIQIEGETTVEALFSRIEYPLTVSIIGEGTVEERVIPARTTTYEEGTVVELTAIADENWIFSRWRGDLSSADSVEVLLVDGPKNVTAEFLRTFNLITISNPEDGGSVTPESGRFVRDSSFDMTATANPGWRFQRWEGDFTGSVNPFNLTMNGNKTIIALFERIAFALILESEGQGEVARELISGTETSDGYLFESEVRLTAIPNAGWRFLSWVGDISSTENPVVIEMSSDISITALFSFFEGGTGSPDDPYQIATLSQLNEIRADLGASYVLLNSIDAGATSQWNDGLGFVPVGSDEEPFTGSLDGNDFEISNLTINNPELVFTGLFGALDGTVKDLTLNNIDLRGDDRVGGLAGFSSGIIRNVRVTGRIEGNNDTGGVAGRNSGTIEHSSVNIEVIGSDHTGGFTGINLGVIHSGVSEGSVTTDGFRTGGFTGVNSGTISRSSASATVSALNVTGGFVGWNRQGGNIKLSYSIGTVEGNDRIGGFVGRHDDESSISDSYSRGDVTGTSAVGGFAGTTGQNSTIERAYSTGAITGVEDLGGFAGRNGGTIAAGYWDIINSGMTEGVGLGADEGVTGLNTEQMTGDEASENMVGFDWEEVWMTVIGGYPILSSEN